MFLKLPRPTHYFKLFMYITSFLPITTATVDPINYIHTKVCLSPRDVKQLPAGSHTQKAEAPML